MSKASRCSVCLASIPPASLAEHQRRFHRPQSAKACTHCSYSSGSLSETIAHCFLEGHGVNRVEYQQLSILPLKLTAMDVGDSTSEPQTMDTLPITVISSEELPYEAKFKGRKQAFPGVDNPLRRTNQTYDDFCEPVRHKQQESAGRLACANCGSVIKASHINDRYTAALQHVKSCHSIRPYACSSCGHLSSQRGHAKSHIKRMCPSGEIVMVDKAGDDAAILAGLRQCFPSQKFKFGGL